MFGLVVDVFAEMRVDLAPYLFDIFICVLLCWTVGDVGGSDAL